MTKSLDEQIHEIESKIYRAELERDVWKGKPSAHYKMASIMVECLKKQRTELLTKVPLDQPDGP